MRNIDIKLESGTMPSAVIIERSTEEKRLETALYIASALVCESEEKKPCGNCMACIKAQSSNHPDIFVLESDSDRKLIKVDEIREIRSDAYILPNEASKKVYIIENAGLMNEQAQNALLKVFEEPPEYACFILLDKSRNVFLETIRSRAMIIDLGQNEQPEKDENAVKIASDMAQAIVKPYELALMEITPIFDKDKDKEKNKSLLKKVLSELVLIFRDAAVYKTGADSTVSSAPDTAKLLAERLTANELIKLIAASDKIAEAIDRNGNYNLILTRLCSTLRSAAEH
ncbi:MAG: hypothetical protein IJD88_07860 [Clostridia bacterium]|nr:hypothetical protein [Clostridia bacterium]